ncbi:UNVERIFIED_CONTAM: hypothetical protein FKN15_013487 [Acipenser sinensis]
MEHILKVIPLQVHTPQTPVNLAMALIKYFGIAFSPGSVCKTTFTSLTKFYSIYYSFERSFVIKTAEEKAWYVRYSAVHAVVKICHHLHGDTAREGLRNASWKALQKQQNDEKDGRVVDAVRVAEYSTW